MTFWRPGSEPLTCPDPAVPTEWKGSPPIGRIADTRKSRFANEAIIGFIRQAVARLPITELRRKAGSSDATFYKWRAEYGAMDVPDARRLRELEGENDKVTKLLAEAHLDIHGLNTAFGVRRHPTPTCTPGSSVHPRVVCDRPGVRRPVRRSPGPALGSQRGARRPSVSEVAFRRYSQPAANESGPP